MEIDTLDDAFRTVSLIDFQTPRTTNEPPTIILFFQDLDIAIASYDLFLETFKNDELAFIFREVSDGIISTTFIRNSTGEELPAFNFNYNKQRLELFENIVPVTRRYAVLFGVNSSDGPVMATTMKPGIFSPIVFDGYQVKWLN